MALLDHVYDVYDKLHVIFNMQIIVLRSYFCILLFTTAHENVYRPTIYHIVRKNTIMIYIRYVYKLFFALCLKNF